ncbi:hypothetical protein BsWGS_19679 [Bradybaena similaris]
MDNAPEIYVYNPVNQNRNIGRRTGKPIYKKRNVCNKLDSFDDYFTDSDDDVSINVTKQLDKSAADGAKPSQIQTGILSSEKSDATKTTQPFFKDLAAKGIQQLPPENFDSVRICNPLTLGSRFGRRTGKDVLEGKALAGGLEDFSALFSDTTDMSLSMQATPPQLAPEQASLSTSAKKSGLILSPNKSRERTQALISTDLRTRHQLEIPAFNASEQQHSQELQGPAFQGQGMSHLHASECIIPAVEVEHMQLVIEGTSLTDAEGKKLQCNDKGSNTVNSHQRLALENPSSCANLSSSEVRNSHYDNEQEQLGLSASKVTTTKTDKENVNTSKVKYSHRDDGQASLSLSMSKAKQIRPEKENVKTSKVKNSCNDEEQGRIYLSASKATQARPEKEHVKSKVNRGHPDDGQESLGLSMSEATQARPEKEHVKSKVNRGHPDDGQESLGLSMSEATQARPEKEHVKSKVNRGHPDDGQESLGLSMSEATQARPEKEHVKSKVNRGHPDDGQESLGLSMSEATQARPEKEHVKSKVNRGHPDDGQESLGLSMSEATQARPEKEHVKSKVNRGHPDDGQESLGLSMSEATQARPEKEDVKTSKNQHIDDEQVQMVLSISKATQARTEKENLMPKLDEKVSRFNKTVEVQTTSEDTEDNNHLKTDESEVYQHTSLEESAKTMSDVQRVAHPFQQSAVTQVDSLGSSKGNKTKSSQSLLIQSTDVQVDGSTAISGQAESVAASQTANSGPNPSIAATSVLIPSDIDQERQQDRSLQTTDSTGRQGASRHMTNPSVTLNFGGDVTGSVSRSEQAVGGQFFGIKKRLSFAYALMESEQPSVECIQNFKTGVLTKAAPRERKSMGSFLGQHDEVSSDNHKTVSQPGKFVTVAPRRSSQLTSDAELLHALNTSTDSQDDFCIVEEETIVCASSEVANKQHVNNKADKKQPGRTRNSKRNSKSYAEKQAKVVRKKQPTDFDTDSQKEDKHLQAKQDNLQKNNQNKTKSMESARAFVDSPDTSLETRPLISLTPQQVTDNRRKEVQGDHKISKRKVKHSIKDQASPPKQIRDDEEDGDISLASQQITDVTENRRKKLQGDKRKVKRSQKDTSSPKQIKVDEEQDIDPDISLNSQQIIDVTENRRKKLQGDKRKMKRSQKDTSSPKQIKVDEEQDIDPDISLNSQQITDVTENRWTEVQEVKRISKRKAKLSMKDTASSPKQIRDDEEEDTDPNVHEKDIDCGVLNNTTLLKLQSTKVNKTKSSKKDGILVVKQLKESNNVSNKNEIQSNLSQMVDDRKGKKVCRRLNITDKLNSSEESLQAPPEDKNTIVDLNTEQNNPVKIGNEGSKPIQSKGKTTKQKKAESLPKQSKDAKLPKLKGSHQRDRSIVLVDSEYSCSDLLQKERVQPQNSTDMVTDDNYPVKKHSQRYSTRSRQSPKSRQLPSVTQLEQHPSITQSDQHPSVTQSEQHPSITQSEQCPSITQSEQCPSVTQSEQLPSVTQSGQHSKPASGNRTVTVGKIKQKLKGSRRNKKSRGRRNQTSGRRSKAVTPQGRKKLARLCTNFNLNAIYENIPEEGSNISDGNFNNTVHSIVEVNDSNSSQGIAENAPVDVPRKRNEKVKSVKNTTLDKPGKENCSDVQESSYTQECDVNQIDHPSSGKNSDRRKTVDISVSLELLEGKTRTATRKSVSSKVRRAVKSLPGNQSTHSESRYEDGTPPKLQLINSLPNVTPQSGVSFRRSRCLPSDLADPESCSPPAVSSVPTRSEECFTPYLKEQKTPVVSSCLKTAESSVRPRRKGRRVRISNIIDQKVCSPVESENCDSPNVITTSLLSVNSSPVHYCETTTNNIDLQAKSPGVGLPDLSYKIIRPQPSDVQGLRRSKRTRVMRLNSHRGEEIIYRRDSTGFGLIVDGIQPSVGEALVKAAEERRLKKLKQRKLKAMNVPAKRAKRLSAHWKVNDVISSSTEVPVINPDNNEQVVLELIARSDSTTWYGPDLTPVTGTEPVALCLHLKQQLFSTGEINLRPLAEKPCEFTEHTLILYVICGKILLRINTVSTIVDTGDSFFIPRGTSYSIKNLRREVAKLYFVDIDDADKEHSFTQSYASNITK